MKVQTFNITGLLTRIKEPFIRYINRIQGSFILAYPVNINRIKTTCHLYDIHTKHIDMVQGIRIEYPAFKQLYYESEGPLTIRLRTRLELIYAGNINNIKRCANYFENRKHLASKYDSRDLDLITRLNMTSHGTRFPHPTRCSVS